MTWLLIAYWINRSLLNTKQLNISQHQCITIYNLISEYMSNLISYFTLVAVLLPMLHAFYTGCSPVKVYIYLHWLQSCKVTYILHWLQSCQGYIHFTLVAVLPRLHTFILMSIINTACVHWFLLIIHVSVFKRVYYEYMHIRISWQPI